MRSVAFSPDGRHLATAGDDTVICLWDLTQPEAWPRIFAGHANSIYSVAFSPDGRALASGGADGTVHLWNVGDQDRAQGAH